DQGTYVGDYAARDLAPAGLAAELVPLMGVRGLRLLPELVANAGRSHPAIAALVARVSDDDAALGAGLRGEIDAVAADGRDRGHALQTRIDVCIDRLG